MPTVATWNVLHRVHAENWKEPTVEAWPQEARRVERIAARVRERLDLGCDAVCLQEVSGDQLSALRAVLPAGALLFNFRYPRLPALRGAARTGLPPSLQEGAEHLVVLLHARNATDAAVEAASAFSSDRGKGFLAVRWRGGELLVCTHITFKKLEGQLAELLHAVAPRPGGAPLTLAGDFNAPRAQVGAALGPGWSLSMPPAGSLATHGRGGQARDIDHVAVREGTVEDARVLETLDGASPPRILSDHRWLQAATSPTPSR